MSVSWLHKHEIIILHFHELSHSCIMYSFSCFLHNISLYVVIRHRHSICNELMCFMDMNDIWNSNSVILPEYLLKNMLIYSNIWLRNCISSFLLSELWLFMRSQCRFLLSDEQNSLSLHFGYYKTKTDIISVHQEQE